MELQLTLAINDLERTELFYREVVGLRLERVSPGDNFPGFLLLRGSTSVLFRQEGDLEASHPALFQNLERHPKGVGVTIELMLPDLDPVLRAVARRQLHTLYEIEDRQHARRELWLHDPDGYLLILVEEQES